MEFDARPTYGPTMHNTDCSSYHHELYLKVNTTAMLGIWGQNLVSVSGPSGSTPARSLRLWSDARDLRLWKAKGLQEVPLRLYVPGPPKVCKTMAPWPSKDLLCRNWSPSGALKGLLFGYLGARDCG